MAGTNDQPHFTEHNTHTLLGPPYSTPCHTHTTTNIYTTHGAPPPYTSLTRIPTSTASVQQCLAPLCVNGARVTRNSALRSE